MKRYSILIPLLLIAISAMGLTLRSPKDAANQSGRPLSKARKALDVSALMPPVPKSTQKRAAVIKPTKPFHLTLQCDKGPPSTKGYNWLKGTNGQISELTGTTTNNWFTFSNLLPGVSYVFVSAAIDTNGLISVYSLPCYWPQPWTNYTALGDSVYAVGPWRTNAIIASTNDRAFYRGRRNGGLYEVVTSPDLKTWTSPVTNWPATNVVLNNVLRHSRWSNWDYAKAD